MSEFHSKVAGISHYQKYVRFCKSGMPLILKLEPENPYDPDAVAVWILARSLFFFTSEVQIGHLEARLAGEISRHIRNGGKISASISEITGGTSVKQTRGVNILINKIT
jgi:single-stranded-DNA-specific exonuclease